MPRIEHRSYPVWDEVTVEALSDGDNVEVLIDGSWCIAEASCEAFCQALAQMIEQYQG